MTNNKKGGGYRLAFCGFRPILYAVFGFWPRFAVLGQSWEGAGEVLEHGAIFEIGLERGAQKNEIVSELGVLMPNKEKRLERGAKLWVGALSDD